MPKACGTRARVVVFTQGSKSTLVACEGRVHEFSVDVLPKEKLIDTNGESLTDFRLLNVVALTLSLLVFTVCCVHMA